MKKNNFEKIIFELEDAGASKKEAEELSLLSQNISNLLSVERSAVVKNRFLDTFSKREQIKKPFTRKWLVMPLFAVLLLIFLGSYTVVSAQKSLPGESLYPVKILSENVVAVVSPGFKGEILKRRSEEIKTLSKQNNSQNSINLQQTIHNYEKILKGDGGINVKSFEESRKNLEEASKSASLENTKEIEKIILQTKNRQYDIQKGKDYKGRVPMEGYGEHSFFQYQNQNQIQNRINIENPLEH